MADPSKLVWIDYTNYRGERRWRSIMPLGVHFQNSEYHPDTQWVIEAIDMERNQLREFAMKDIHEWRATAP